MIKLATRRRHFRGRIVRTVRSGAWTALLLAVGLLVTACLDGTTAQPGPVARASALLSSGRSASSGALPSSMPSTAASSGGVLDSAAASSPDSGTGASDPPTSVDTTVTAAAGQPTIQDAPTTPGVPAGGGDPGSGTTTSSTNPTDARDKDPSDFGSAADGYYWTSPTGNINCYAQNGTVYCGASQHSFSYEGSNCVRDAEGVEIEPGFLVEVTCGGDPPQNIHTLAYGVQITVGTVTCVSRQSAMTCVDAAHGDGFSINRSQITILPNGDHPLAYQPESGHGGDVPSPPATPATPASPTTPAPPTTPTPQYVGTWHAHGALLSISASGTATAVYRTYRWCGTRIPAPCDSKNGNSIFPGGHLVVAVGPITNDAATGQVEQSNDPRYPVGSAFPMQWSGSRLHTPLDVFCSGDSSCGA